MGSIFATVPAVAAAVGFYFIDKNNIKVRMFVCVDCIILYQH